jgi:chromosome segregation ATPase
MTVDQRLERLTERHEALTQSVELMAAENKQRDKRMGQIMEGIARLNDTQTVTAAQTSRHEDRVKEHQQWLEDNKLAYTRHREAMAEFDQKMTQLSAAQLLNEEKWRELQAKLDGFIDGLRRGGNGHN